VQVRSADARAIDPDQDIIDSDLRLGDLLKPKSGLGAAFHEGFHASGCQLTNLR
jgi:hypothetical protein